MHRSPLWGSCHEVPEGGGGGGGGGAQASTQLTEELPIISNQELRLLHRCEITAAIIQRTDIDQRLRVTATVCAARAPPRLLMDQGLYGLLPINAGMSGPDRSRMLLVNSYYLSGLAYSTHMSHRVTATNSTVVDMHEDDLLPQFEVHSVPNNANCRLNATLSKLLAKD